MEVQKRNAKNVFDIGYFQKIQIFDYTLYARILQGECLSCRNFAN